ncbi:MAG TPA: TolC family protein, partial [Planctomycetia bacterium]|nr:TolC family protein [Planctomycetia bacterium]
ADLVGAEKNLRLYSAEEFILPLTLVSLDEPADSILARALSNGPGIGELQAILQSLEEQACLARKYRFAPQIAVDVGGGGFGGGTGGTYGNWGGRNDLGAHVYWDLSDTLRAKQKSDVYQAKRRQSDLGLQQARQKIETGVRAMIDQAERSRDRLQLAEAQILRVLEQLPKVRKLRDAAEPNTPQIISAFTYEAKTIGDLAKARQAYLEALLDYNRAQVTLYHLSGTPEVAANPTEARSTPRGSSTPDAKGEAPGTRTDHAPGEAKPTSGGGGNARPKGSVQRIRGPVPRVPTDER